MDLRTRPLLAAALAAVAFAGCPEPRPQTPDVIEYDVTYPDGEAPDDVADGRAFCSRGAPVPGAAVPRGFCIRRYAEVREARTLAIAPNGDVFVGAPSRTTGAGLSGGPGAIVVLHDDNGDGAAETTTFAQVPDVHGLAIAGGFVWFTTETGVFRTPYTMGQRRETGGRQQVATFPSVNGARWTHGLAVSQGGAVYATQGVYSAMQCPDTPREGSIRRLGMPGAEMTVVAEGFRNPMYIRCHQRDEVCLAAELGDDGGLSYGAREKILLVRPNTNYGFPCCATTNRRAPSNNGAYDCARVTPEESTIPLNDTPFGLDWERGRWPLPFRDGVFVALHGSFYSVPAWQGARIAFARTDPTTHAPTGEWLDFVLGFGPQGSPLDRPSDVAFAPDGRMFFSDDQGGAVYFVAPETLRIP